MKCENARHVQNCKRLLNTSNLDIIWFILETPELFFIADFQQVFYKSFFDEKPLFQFFVAVVYNTFLQE